MATSTTTPAAKKARKTTTAASGNTSAKPGTPARATPAKTPKKASATAAATTGKAAKPASSPAPEAPLAKYQRKRNFGVTSEPSGEASPSELIQPRPLSFVIQKHWASRLHYDFRLEHDGVLLSWALPKGLSFDPSAKHLAIHVEDHPVSYGSFEGTIPPKQYGAGTVIVWDTGTWEPVGDASEGMRVGKLLFKLHGQKLAGLWELVRISKPGEKQDRWMIFKKRGDAWTRPLADYDVINALPDSVIAKPLGLVEEREPDRTGNAPQLSPTTAAPDLALATKSALPATLEPQLATLASEPPSGNEWLPETKYDGYRFTIRVDKGKARFITRGGHDWTDRLLSLAAQVEALGIESAWLDGEVVVLKDGIPDFGLLQNAIGKLRNDETVLFLFDVPFANGLDLRKVPLWSRRAYLRNLLKGKENERLRFSEDFAAPAAQVLAAACALKLEGVMLKHRDAPYVSGRTETWLKLKCSLRQEFVVVGFTDRSNASTEVGSLLLAYHKDGKLTFAGSVGTGWNSKLGREMHTLMRSIETKKASVDVATTKPGRWSRRAVGTERWVKPEVVVEVAFTEWTSDGHVRHPSFKGIRSDKPASDVTLEKATAPADTGKPANSDKKPAAALHKLAKPIKLSHPDRVIDPSTGLTKLDLFRYYESVADWILPHLANRPVSLVRAPDGITGELFFQKHPESRMPGLTALDPSLWPGHGALLSVDSIDALLAAAQMNTVEFHTWNSTASDIDRPDRVIFDLDPGEGVTWAHVQEAAVLTRSMLQQLGLESWLKTSGGKGLHVVVPLAPDLDYTAVKAFSQSVVQHMAKVIPQRFVSKMGGTNRVGKIFIDYLRNGHGQTTAAAFSARSRPGLGVSMPISWEQLTSLKSASQWTISTAREYLSFEKQDPWAGFWKAAQTLAQAIDRLG